MTSININTISKKPNFINYFSEPITFPPNAQVALPKANFQVPIVVNPVIDIPKVLEVNYDDSCLDVRIDGVALPITWRNIYDAHVRFETANQSAEDIGTVNDIDEYFAKYKFLPNNGCVWLAPNQADAFITNKMKIPFDAILADAISNKFNFYRATPASLYEGDTYAFDTSLMKDVLTLGIIKDADGAAINGITISATNQKQTTLGLNIHYDPSAVTDSANVAMNWTPAELTNNWTAGVPNNGSLTSTDTGINIGFAGDGNFNMDPNGGWVSVQPNFTAEGKMAFGLNLQGGQLNPGLDVLTNAGTTISDTEFLPLIDIGFLFEQDANGEHNFQVVNGSSTNAGMVTSNVTPYKLCSQFTNDTDFFYILISRASLLKGDAGKFVAKLIFGSGGQPRAPDTDDIVIAEIPIEFGGGMVFPTLVALGDAVVGNSLENCRYIDLGDQSIQQGQFLRNSIGVPLNAGDTFVNSISLDPDIGILDYGDAEFWGQWGLSNMVTSVGDYVPIFGKDVNDLIRTWSVPTNFSESTTQYTIGLKNINQIYNTTNAYIDVNSQFSVSDIPQQFHVALNNVDVKSFHGIYITAGDTNPGGGGGTLDSTSLTRSIGTVKVDVTQVGQGASVLNVQYEPFNLLYRPLNNSVPFTTNQLDIVVSYRDFATGIAKTLWNVVGTIDLDIHVRNGPKPLPVVNSLRPY